jgi:hypothetical protein
MNLSLIQTNLSRYQVERFPFIIAACWTIFMTAQMNRSYQDSWLLDGVWLPFILTFFLFLFNIAWDSDLRWVAVLTSTMVFLSVAVPSLKYSTLYSSTIDTSVHFSMMRTLASTGHADSNAYAFTLGFHILVASLAQLSGLSVESWAKIWPGVVGSLHPLGVYMLCRRIAMLPLLAKSLLLCSGLSLSLLYLPNGTTYALLLISPLLMLLVLQASESHQKGKESENSMAYTLLILLLLATLMIWHAISSLLVPATIGTAGLLSLVLSALLSKAGRRHRWLRRGGLFFILIGLAGTILVLIYWKYIATPIWLHLMTNIESFISVLVAEGSTDGVLVPQRTLTLTLSDLMVVFLFYHARDAAMLALAGIGVVTAIWSLFRTNDASKAYMRSILFFGLLLAAFSFIFVTILGTGFSAHGYQRFILYLMAACVLPAGYGFWQILRVVSGRYSATFQKMTFVAAVALLYLIASLQFYPYQPAIPTKTVGAGSPLYWHHQVNTEYQRSVIGFALTQLDGEINRFTDYVTYQQSAIFFGIPAKKRFHYGEWNRAQSSYVLLHSPGLAGPYAEQVEYRSSQAISGLRYREGVSTVYDNGGSFMLYVPADLMPYYTLKAPKNQPISAGAAHGSSD